MSKQDSTAPAERFDLEPDPEPAAQDVIEGLAEVLEVAVDLAEPKRTAARCLTITGQVRAAARGSITAGELLVSLDRLTQDWRSS